jgi:hypothetical protein
LDSNIRDESNKQQANLEEERKGEREKGMRDEREEEVREREWWERERTMRVRERTDRQTDRQTETLFDEGLMFISLWHENAQYINIRTVLLHQRIHHRANTHTLSFLFQLYFQCRAAAANTWGTHTVGNIFVGWVRYRVAV